MEISSHILKISGNAELPSALELGKNYQVQLEGTVVKKEDSDNHNGTFDVKYTIKPVMVTLTDETGESIKAKDTRSNSQLYRGLCKKWYIENNVMMDFDEFYEKMYKKNFMFFEQFAKAVIKGE